VDRQRKFDEDILVAEAALLEATTVNLVLSGGIWRAYFSVVNLLSLYAVIKAGDNLNARRLRAPCELRLTSWISATVFSFSSFW
jgi:hypothetical protein